MQKLQKHLDLKDVTYIPISALNGDNIVDRSRKYAMVRRRLFA